MGRILELNLDHTGIGLGITTKQHAWVQEGKYQGESLVSSGKNFQQHRYNMQPAYIANCIRDTSGLHSVSFKAVDTMIKGDDCNIGYLTCCDECNVKPFLYEGKSFIHRNKTFLFTKYNELYVVGCEGELTLVELRGLNRKQLKDVVDINSVQGQRIVIMTSDEIYYSSLLDGTGKTGNWGTDLGETKPYIDFYNLGGATGKFSISSSIGQNKLIVVVANLMYFLGSMGGVLTRLNDEDELYPFSLMVVKNFSGVSHRDHANVKSDKLSDFLINSTSGIGVIDQDTFVPIMDELDNELDRDIAAYFNIKFCGETLYADSCLPCEGSRLPSSNLSHNVVTLLSPHESVTKDNDYAKEVLAQYDEPLVFEQGGYESSHFKVTSTVRYFIISHNSGVTVSDCCDTCVCYNRMYLYDRRLQSGTMLHINHKDVIMVEEELYISSDRYVKKLIKKFDKDMPSIVYYKGMELHTSKWTQISELNLRGRFLPVADMGAFSEPIFAVHTEESGMHYQDKLSLYHRSPHDIKYGDIIRGKALDFVIPFAGYLSSVQLNYHR